MMLYEEGKLLLNDVGAWANRRLWSAQYSLSRNAFAASTSAMPFRRSFFTRRS
jgi:hypothetical protein